METAVCQKLLHKRDDGLSEKKMNDDEKIIECVRHPKGKQILHTYGYCGTRLSSSRKSATFFLPPKTCFPFVLQRRHFPPCSISFFGGLIDEFPSMTISTPTTTPPKNILQYTCLLALLQLSHFPLLLNSFLSFKQLITKSPLSK